jgi:hypothetical protein
MAKANSKKGSEAKVKLGAPELEYTQEMGDKICDAIATSALSLKKLCKANPDFPCDKLIYKWVFKHPSFGRQYELAKEMQQLVLVESQDEIFDKAEKHTYRDREGNDRIDGGAVQLAKMRSDNIKWVASRLSRKFRDKLEVKSVDGKKRTAEEVKAEIDKLRKHERKY